MVKNKKKFKVSGTKPTNAVVQQYRAHGTYHVRKRRELSFEAEEIYKRIERIDELIDLGVTSKKLSELVEARKILVSRFKYFREGPPPKQFKASISKSVRTVEHKLSFEKGSTSASYKLDVDLENFYENDYYADPEVTEGSTILRKHLSHERNTQIVQLKKKKILEETGCLKCEVCEFDFFEVYGERGLGFIECHHLIPLSKTQVSTKTRLSDLSLVCSNCHRMIHNKKPLLTINELKKIIFRK